MYHSLTQRIEKKSYLKSWVFQNLTKSDIGIHSYLFVLETSNTMSRKVKCYSSCDKMAFTISPIQYEAPAKHWREPRDINIGKLQTDVIMAGTQFASKDTITLKGSAELVVEYFSMNIICFFSFI